MANGDPEIMGLSKVYVPGGDPNYAAPMLVLSEAEAQKYAAWLNEYNEKMGRPVVKFSVPERADLFGEALAERDAEIEALKAKLADAMLGRERVLSWFAWLIGGWNATQGAHTGRLRFDGMDYDSDEAVARHILDTAKSALKAKLKERTRELIRWMQIAVGPSDPMTVVLAAKRKIEELEKEMEK